MTNKKKIATQTVIDVLRGRMLDVHAYDILAEMGIDPPPRKWRLVFEVDTAEDLDDWFAASEWIDSHRNELRVGFVSSEEVK